jgi:hypothetical protein
MRAIFNDNVNFIEIERELLLFNANSAILQHQLKYSNGQSVPTTAMTCVDL